MIGFNALLRDKAISPADVKLARHQATEPKVRRDRLTPYDLWLTDHDRLEQWQSIQRKDRFAGAKFIAAFVATPLNETLFVGMFENCGVTKAKPGLRDPIDGSDAAGCFLYDLKQSGRLIEYRGRLVVDWGPGFLAWVQWACKHDKPIVEISGFRSEPMFPGFLDFREPMSRFASVPGSWRIALQSVKGVYLLICLRCGKQYVGAASGEGGFWARWLDHVSSGYRATIGMRDHPHRDYQVRVLEVASSSAGSDQISHMEDRWKKTLLTNEFGLNKN